jgi:hypothetical protein
MCFIAGVTPALDTHWAVNQTLGERFVQVRPQAPAPIAVANRSMGNVGHEEEMRSELQAAVTEFMGSLEFPTIGQVDLPGEIMDALAALATFVVRARSAVFRDGYQREITYIPTPEGPARLAKQLATLIRGRAIIAGRTAVTVKDMDEIREIGLDCIPQQRRKVIDVLLQKELVTTTAIATASGYPTNSTRRILEELKAVELIERVAARDEGGNVDRWQLSDEASQWHAKTLVPEISLLTGGERN